MPNSNTDYESYVVLQCSIEGGMCLVEELHEGAKSFAGRVLLDLLYPRRCPLCKNVLDFQESKVCDSCLKKQKWVKPPYCLKCGKTVEAEEDACCGDCTAMEKSFQRGYPAFHYIGEIKEALYAFKYNNQRSYGDFFADCIMKQYGEELKHLQFDGLIPVPVHKKKKRVRGYNQAEVLAKELGKQLRIPVYPSYLVRVVNTNPQKELNDKTRMKNLKNAFKIGQNTIELKKVLLVDDIYTSGATIEACTKVLLAAGVEKVYYTSVAIGKGYSV